jgi:uncharacterized membrane protein
MREALHIKPVRTPCVEEDVLSQQVVVYAHHRSVLYAILAFLLVVVVATLLVFVGEVAFQRIGLGSLAYTLILVGTLAGSAVNIPVGEARSSEPIVEVQEVRVFGLYYRIPRIRQVSTVIAVNLGGAIIPVLVSIYLLVLHAGLLVPVVEASLIMSVIVHLMAKKVKGVGIVTPSLLPPLAAAIVAYLVSPTSPAIVAYISGTMGALIGADLSNMRGITKLGAPMVSIGGAGTFDGVFLTGIVAVLLVPLL